MCFLIEFFSLSFLGILLPAWIEFCSKLTDLKTSYLIGTVLFLMESLELLDVGRAAFESTLFCICDTEIL